MRQQSKHSFLRHLYRDNVLSGRFLAAVVLVLSYYLPLLLKLRELAGAVGVRMNAVTLLFLMVGEWNMALFFVGLLMVVANVPFYNNLHLQIVLRTGKRRWILSQVKYLMALVTTYLVVVLLGMFAIVFPMAGFYPHWGKFIGTWIGGGHTQFLSQAHLMTIPKSIVESWSVFDYTWRFLALLWVILLFFAMLVFCGNLLYKRLGFMLGSGIIFFGLFAPAAQGAFLYKYSPLSWLSLQNLLQGSSVLTMRHVGTYLGVSMAVFIGILCFKSRKKSTLDF